MAQCAAMQVSVVSRQEFFVSPEMREPPKGC